MVSTFCDYHGKCWAWWMCLRIGILGGLYLLKPHKTLFFIYFKLISWLWWWKLIFVVSIELQVAGLSCRTNTTCHIQSTLVQWYHGSEQSTIATITRSEYARCWKLVLYPGEHFHRNVVILRVKMLVSNVEKNGRNVVSLLGSYRWGNYFEKTVWHNFDFSWHME